MCETCSRAVRRQALTRRSLGAAALAVAGAAAFRAPPARADGAPVEPRMRLADVPADQPVVALTLDACPGGFDERLARALVENGIPATIFVTALWLRRNPAGLAFLLDHRPLFAFENHGARHVPPVLGGRIYGIAGARDLDAVRTEVTEGASAITSATGSVPHWYRGATGYYSRDAITAIEAMGVAIAGYSLNADMGASLPAATVAHRIAGAVSGDVIVGHINQPNRASGQGIADGAKALQRRGVSFVHLTPATRVNLVV